jgi:hypothetical protein
MSRIRIDDALLLAEQIRAKKNILVKANMELFDEIKALDETIKDVIDEIYTSQDLTAYDVITINQSLNLNDILSRSMKFGIGNKDFSEACSSYSEGNVKVFFIDSEDFIDASVLSYGENAKEIVKEELYLSDGKNVRYWDGQSFSTKFLEYCKKK